MAEEPENIVLVYLSRLDERVDFIAAEIGDIKTPVTDIEERIGQFDLRLVQVDISTVGINQRIDRVGAHLYRIERRLDVVELPH
jgi:hypothetical protein